MDADDAPLVLQDRQPREPLGLADHRTRALVEVAQARVANSWLRFGACAIVAVVTMALAGTALPLYWLAGLAVVISADRIAHQRLLKACEGRPAPSIRALTAWTAIQSTYGNSLAIILWFSPHVPSESLAIIFLCGALANAAATLRASTPLAIAGVGPTVAFLLGLPVAEFVINGGQHSMDLMPLIGGLLLLGFGMNLWRSLLASDAAHARAEEAALRERQAAAAAAAAKTDTIRRVDDEMRTPMMALIGATEHLHRVAATPAARAHIATLLHAGEVLKQALDDLSDLDRLDNGGLRLEPTPTVVRDLVRGVVSAFRTTAHDKNLELFADIAADTPACVEIDALRVRQVLFNLLANAVRFTLHGGVRMRVCAQASAPGRVHLSFTITDTGMGMSRTQLAALFNRDRVAREEGGSGLGLAISLKLARAMGGQISARSESGEGSVFTFTLDAPVLSRAANAAA